MTKAKKWLDWDGRELTPVSDMPDVDEICDGDQECENQPTISIRPYYLHWKSESICGDCLEKRYNGP